jgi:hypothetical protein
MDALSRAPRQTTISWMKRNRLSLVLRQSITAIAVGIREAAHDHGIRSSKLPSPPADPDPDEIRATDQPLYQYVDDTAPQLIDRLLKTVTPAFDTGRASNAQHSDRAIWKHQIAMSLMHRAGTRSAYRTFNKFRSNPPHHDTHTRAVKKLGTPSRQRRLAEFASIDHPSEVTPRWRRIADTIQSQFSTAVDRLLENTRMSDTFTEPVVAAIDTTGIPVHVTPYKGEDDIEPDDRRVVVDEETGETKVPKDDYPEMINGAEEDGVYEYQYATLSIVGRNTPLVVAVEPIRHHSKWEEDGQTVSWAEVVDRLMEQATDLVDIHLVMADRAFDGHGVFHVLDQKHDVNYLLPKKEDSKRLRQDADCVREDDDVNALVEQDASLYLRDSTPYIDTDKDETVGEDGYSHDVTFMHVPADRDDWIVTGGPKQDYALFVTNRDDEITPMDAIGFTNRYSDR